MNDYNEIINEALKELKENADNFNEITKKAFVQIIIKDDDDELIKKFLNYGNVFARQAMAKYGNNEIRWQLINDKAWEVRKTIAKNGTDEMRSHLIDDEEYQIRAKVAQYGSKEICEILKNDKGEYVRRVAENRLEELEKEKRKDERNKESEE